jgi:hypothetical protein
LGGVGTKRLLGREANRSRSRPLSLRHFPGITPAPNRPSPAASPRCQHRRRGWDGADDLRRNAPMPAAPLSGAVRRRPADGMPGLPGGGVIHNLFDGVRIGRRRLASWCSRIRPVRWSGPRAPTPWRAPVCVVFPGRSGGSDAAPLTGPAASAAVAQDNAIVVGLSPA